MTESRVPWNPAVRPVPIFITTGNAEYFNCAGIGGFIATGFITSTAWPAAKVVLYLPFVIDRSYKVLNLGWYNGTTAAGNSDMGIYNEAGTRLVATGTIANSGNAAPQFVAVSYTLGGPGRYYLAFTSDSTNPYAATTLTVAGCSHVVGSMTETTSSFGLTNPWGTTAMSSTEVLPGLSMAASSAT